MQILIKSTWKDPIGTKLTNKRISNRIREGWYGRIAQLRLLARGADKAKRRAAKEELKRFDGIMVKTKKLARPVDIMEFV